MLIDYNQLVISSIVGSMSNKNNQDTVLTEDLARHIVLNSIREARVHFRGTHAQTIVCCDDRKYWREAAFPYYKARRKERHRKPDKSGIDWVLLFSCLAKFRSEFAETFPWIVLQVENCEADDLIATICKTGPRDRPTMILSSDKDFRQLQIYPNVQQWSNHHSKLLTEEDPKSYLKKLTIKGDDGDDVPNILSDDDTFVHPNKRQSPMTAKRLANYMSLDPEEYDDKARAGWDRNRKLVDLINGIPEEVEQKILEQLEAKANKPKEPKKIGDMSLMNYFIKHKLNKLRTSIQEFV